MLVMSFLAQGAGKVPLLPWEYTDSLVGHCVQGCFTSEYNPVTAASGTL